LHICPPGTRSAWLPDHSAYPNNRRRHGLAICREHAFGAIAIPVLFTLLFTYLFGGALCGSPRANS
jgi:hypothetical protein